MGHMSIRLGEDLTGQVSRAIGEFHYTTKTDFVKDAIRHRLKELGLDKKRDEAWHKLLNTQEKVKGKKAYYAKELPHHARLNIQDLIKRGYQKIYK